VYSVAVRRWRKQITQRSTWAEIAALKTQLAHTNYDVILDAQGLLKSAWLSRWAQGKRVGFDYASVREPLASFFYQQRWAVSRTEHAIERTRTLAARQFAYTLDNLALDYGLALSPQTTPPAAPYIVALHGTSRVDKEWSLNNWQYLIQQLALHQWQVYLPWGNAREYERATFLATHHANAQLVPKSNLTELKRLISAAHGVIGMDTGLLHIAAALGKAGVALYPTTDTALTGARLPSTAQTKLTNLSGAETRSPELVTRTLLDNVAT